MDILNILDDRSDDYLMSYEERELTRRDFSDLVKRLYKEFTTRDELRDDGFIALTVDSPVFLYAAAFALWKNGNRILFPSRDYFEDPSSLNFHRYSLVLEGEEIRFQTNDTFRPLRLPPKGDTIVFSSGSTGVPKGVLHNRNHFLKNARSTNQKLNLNNYRSLTPLKPYLVSAFSHFIVHYISGSYLRFMDYERIHDIRDFYQKDPELAFVGSPMHILSSFSYIPEGSSPKFFFSSGDFMHPHNIQAILKKFPKSTYYNVYGLAEVAGRLFVNRIDSSMDYAHYAAVGENLEGTSYKLIEDQIHVQSDFLYYGYVTGEGFVSSQSPYPSGDLLRMQEGVPSLCGRANDEVKIGGNKISLKYLEGKISAIFPDDLCILFDDNHPRLGTFMALGLKTKNRYKRVELIRRLRAQLKPYEIPQMFYYLAEIPYKQSMKVDRAAIRLAKDSLTPIT